MLRRTAGSLIRPQASPISILLTQSSTRAFSSAARKLDNNKNTSSLDFLKDMKTPSPSSPSTPSALFDLDKMLTPSSSSPNQHFSADRSMDSLRSLSTSYGVAPTKPVLRLNAKTGRTITVRKDVDVAKAFTKANILCAVNKVSQDFRKQRFHERNGIKRKRLKVERWRRRFMEGFKATVGRVKEMKKQGW
jgi:hypothetical protein